MKTITRIFLLGLLLFPMCALAQKATDEKEYEVRVEWAEMRGYSSWSSYKVPVYYDKNDEAVKHGPFRVNYKEDLTRRVGKKFINTYTVSGSYVNGKLNGALYIEQVISTYLGSYKTKGTLNFIKGVPSGTWTFSQIITAGGENETYNLTVLFKKNKIATYNKNNKKYYFTVNSDSTFSGKLDDVEYKNSVNISTFIRKTGEETNLDSIAQSVANAFIAGTMSESDLIAKGYVFQKKSWEDCCDFGALEYYISILSADHFMEYGGVSVTVDDIVATTKKDENMSPTYTLKRVNVISAEDLISKANAIKIVTNDIKYSNEYNISWIVKGDGKESVCYDYRYGRNYINILGDGDYYFTEEAKLKFEEAIKTSLEERRKEEERIAEEKRKEEARLAEERRKEARRRAEEWALNKFEEDSIKFQPLCDYLVAQKKASRISKEDGVDMYFSFTSGYSYGRYSKDDLSDKIKPFCKIVDCKFVSYDGEVAVFFITKYDKKGNITYQVPVTIENNKILVSSLDISKAKVVVVDWVQIKEDRKQIYLGRYYNHKLN